MRPRDVLFGAVVALAQIVSVAHGSSGGDREVVIEWNQLLTDTTPATLGLQAPRYYSMLHVAMFDAVNSINDRFTRYHTRVRASAGASTDAAAAQAAHDVLYALITDAASRQRFDSALAARLAGIAPGRAAQGIAVGAAVAQRVLAWRANDGWSEAPPPYVLPSLPGLWQPTPPANALAAAAQLRYVMPFALLTPTQYQARRFPELTSDEYAADLNEVKAIGSATSAVRTAEETISARIWAGVGYRSNPFTVWMRVARDTARSKSLTLSETARLFAAVSVAMNDGLQASMSAKFVYGLWRPVTAIRRADEDLNPATMPDPTWLSLLPTPPYPSHPGNVACISASVTAALTRVFKNDNVAFSITWLGVPPVADVTRNYQGFSDAAVDATRSRVLGGLHYTFEQEASEEACPNVAHWLMDHYMRPKWSH
jgi:hypothetical protein